jgi:hypothetical protein
MPLRANLNRNALAFLRLASIRLMLPKLCNPASDSGLLLGALKQVFG